MSYLLASLKNLICSLRKLKFAIVVEITKKRKKEKNIFKVGLIHERRLFLLKSMDDEICLTLFVIIQLEIAAKKNVSKVAFLLCATLELYFLIFGDSFKWT